MTTPQNDTAADTPEARAEAAARDLADRGLPVTARAVRSAAGVRMSIASETAKAWNDAAAETDTLQVPDVPQDVTARLTAIWTDAYRAAHTALVPEYNRVTAELNAARSEVDSLTGDVVAMEADRDDLARRLTEAEATAAEATGRTMGLERAARDAALRLESVERERDRLAAQIDALIARIPATTDTEDATADSAAGDQETAEATTVKTPAARTRRTRKTTTTQE